MTHRARRPAVVASYVGPALALWVAGGGSAVGCSLFQKSSTSGAGGSVPVSDAGPDPACTTATDGGTLPSYDWALWPAPPDSPPDSQYVISADGDTVTDQATGLIWQRNPYPNVEATAASCEALNAKGFGGCTSGWRLPSLVELVSIVDFGQTKAPFINMNVFPGVSATADQYSAPNYPSSTGMTGSAWAASFYNPSTFVDTPTGPSSAISGNTALRCVAGPLGAPAVPAPPARYTVPGDGTVHDDVTKLIWQQSVPHSQCCKTADQAAAACGTLILGGLSGWRLPTIKELVSIVDGRAASSNAPQTPFDFATFGSDTVVLNGYWSGTAGQTFDSYPAAAMVRASHLGWNGIQTLGQVEFQFVANSAAARCVHGAIPGGGPDCGIPGVACATGADCCSGTCDAATKKCDACIASGIACATNTDCCTGFCAGGTPIPTFCSCRPEGYPCTDASTCCTGVCFSGQCQVSSTCLDVGTLQCNTFAALCCAPSVCKTTTQVPVPTCCLPTGTDCSQNTQACCNQTVCVNGKCG